MRPRKNHVTALTRTARWLLWLSRTPANRGTHDHRLGHVSPAAACILITKYVSLNVRCVYWIATGTITTGHASGVLAQLQLPYTCICIHGRICKSEVLDVLQLLIGIYLLCIAIASRACGCKNRCLLQLQVYLDPMHGNLFEPGTFLPGTSTCALIMALYLMYSALGLNMIGLRLRRIQWLEQLFV